MTRLSRFVFFLLGSLTLAACQPTTSVLPDTGGVTASVTAALLPQATATQTPQPTFTSTLTKTPPPPSETPAPRLCSPIEGYSLDEITALVVNPFNPPPPGSDDPHQGVDLADRQAGSLIALSGKPVQAILDGKVATVIQDRFPYGNALIVETPLEDLPEAWVSALLRDNPLPVFKPNLALTCPDVVPKIWQATQSLYLLYAHLQQAPELKLEDEVSCGQAIGKIGDSGNALNPHLHLEARLGPGGARFTSMAHYDNRATLEEMDNYCTWRIRGIFWLVNPLSLLGLP